MNDRTKTAFEFARDTAKEFLTLATGIIALTITFSKDFVRTVPPSARMFAVLSWGAFLLSVFFGLLTLMALTGSLEKQKEFSIYDSNIRLPAGAQILTFFAGLVLAVVFGIKAT